MPSKSLFPRGFMAAAERMGEQYRTELGISKFDPLDAFALAKHIDIPVFSVEDAYKDNFQDPSYTLLSDTSKFHAMWMPNEDGDRIIIHNANQSKNRQQSNIMHELAHIIRNHEIPTAYAILCADFGLHCYNPIHEQEAKYLGGCLQITKPGLLWALKHFTVEEISERYTASIEMVNYRIGVSGVKKIRGYRK